MATGRTGSDAIAIALAAICRTILKYHVKLDAFIDAQVTAGHITSGDAVQAHAFIDAATATCAIFQVLAQYSGF